MLSGEFATQFELRHALKATKMTLAIHDVGVEHNLRLQFQRLLFRVMKLCKHIYIYVYSVYIYSALKSASLNFNP